MVFRSYVFDVERRTIRHDDTTFQRDVAVHPGAVAVLAINDSGEVGFIRQYRAAFDEFQLEIPAGTQDVKGELALDAAKRELLEEMGCIASEWKLLGKFMNSPGWTNQVMTIFEARNLTQQERAPAGVEERYSSVHWLSPSTLKKSFHDAPAIDSTTAIALHRIFGTFLDES